MCTLRTALKMPLEGMYTVHCALYICTCTVPEVRWPYIEASLQVHKSCKQTTCAGTHVTSKYHALCESLHASCSHTRQPVTRSHESAHECLVGRAQVIGAWYSQVHTSPCKYKRKREYRALWVCPNSRVPSATTHVWSLHSRVKHSQHTCETLTTRVYLLPCP